MQPGSPFALPPGRLPTYVKQLLAQSGGDVRPEATPGTALSAVAGAAIAGAFTGHPAPPVSSIAVKTAKAAARPAAAPAVSGAAPAPPAASPASFAHGQLQTRLFPQRGAGRATPARPSVVTQNPGVAATCKPRPSMIPGTHGGDHRGRRREGGDGGPGGVAAGRGVHRLRRVGCPPAARHTSVPAPTGRCVVTGPGPTRRGSDACRDVVRDPARHRRAGDDARGAAGGHARAAAPGRRAVVGVPLARLGRLTQPCDDAWEAREGGRLARARLPADSAPAGRYDRQHATAVVPRGRTRACGSAPAPTPAAERRGGRWLACGLAVRPEQRAAIAVTGPAEPVVPAARGDGDRRPGTRAARRRGCDALS